MVKRIKVINKKNYGMVIYNLLIIISLLININCNKDPIQADLLDYINKDLKELAELESAAVDAYGGSTGDNYTSDEELYQTLNTTVIPKYKEFNSRLEKVSIATSEVKDVHEKYISASNKQYQAFLKLQIAIEKQDKNLVLESNALLDSARKDLRDWKFELNELCKSHDVTFN